MMIQDHFDARSLLYFNCNWCHFLHLIFVTSAFHTLMPQECVCVWGGRGGGYLDIFIYIRRLGPFLGVQNLEFQYFEGFQKYRYFRGYEDFVDISLQNWTGFRGHFYTFQGGFLRSMCRMGKLFGLAQNYKVSKGAKIRNRYCLGSG